MRRRSFIPTTANGNATNISDPKWVKLESDDGELAPLGPSNDDVPPEEIIAAELAQNPDVWAQWGDCSQLIDDDLTRLGVRGFLSLGALSPDAEHSAMSFQDELDRRDYWAGWLARDIAGLTEPDDAWSWDPWRPVAGQYEAHMAKGDAMLDEAIESTEARLDRLQAETASAMAALLASVDEPVHAWRPGRPTPPDSFAPIDTASHEPWHTTEETQMSDADETRLRQATCEGLDGEPARHGAGS